MTWVIYRRDYHFFPTPPKIITLIQEDKLRILLGEPPLEEFEEFRKVQSGELASKIFKYANHPTRYFFRSIRSRVVFFLENIKHDKCMTFYDESYYFESLIPESVGILK